MTIPLTDYKESVRAASVSSLNLAAIGSTIDGVTLIYGDVFLVKDQPDPSQNGLYTYLGPLTLALRSAYGKAGMISSGALVIVEEGATNADRIFMLTTDNPIVVGSTPLVFTEVGGGQGAPLETVTTTDQSEELTDIINIVDSSAGVKNMTLPTGLSNGHRLRVKRVGSNTVNISPISFGASSLDADEAWMDIIYDGSDWHSFVSGAPAVAVDTFPLLEGISSPAADTIRFTGQRFLTASEGAVGFVVPRLADYGTASPLDGSGMVVNLSALSNGWVLNTHTDTVIELSNPAFTSDEPSGGPGDFDVVGVAFHDVTSGSTYYFYEPWGDPSPYSATVAAAPPVVPNFLASYSVGTDFVTITSDVPYFNIINAAEVYIDGGGPYVMGSTPGIQYFILDSPTQIRLIATTGAIGNTANYGAILDSVFFDTLGVNDQTYTGPLALS